MKTKSTKKIKELQLSLMYYRSNRWKRDIDKILLSLHKFKNTTLNYDKIIPMLNSRSNTLKSRSNTS